MRCGAHRCRSGILAIGQVLGQSVVIENRGGGAGGSIGAKFVASADPDGYTILITPGGSLTTGPAVRMHPDKARAVMIAVIENRNARATGTGAIPQTRQP